MVIRIGVVANPGSRYLKRRPEAVARLRALVGRRRGGILAVSDDVDAVGDIAAHFRHHGVDVVGVVGGDGTTGITARAFLDVYGDAPIPPFALLRGGTMNTVANSLGVPRARPEAALRRLLERTAAGERPAAPPRATMAVDGRLGFLFGTGAFHAFLERYYAAGGDDPSATTAARTIARVAASVVARGPLARRLVRPHVAEVEIDGERLPERPYLALCAGTATQVGLGFEPFHLAGRFRGAFHFLALTGEPREVVRDLGRVWLGLGVRPNNGRDHVARDVVIRPRGGALDYMVDGDLYRVDGDLRVAAGPSIPIIA